MKKEQLTLFNRGQSSKLFKQVVKTGEPLLVMQRDKGLVVIIAAEKYAELTNEPITILVPTYQTGEKDD